MKDVDRALMNAGERATRRIAESWALTGAELAQLVSPTESDREPALQYVVAVSSDADIRALRISCLLGIYGALSVLFTDMSQANGWIRRPNSASPLSGSTALEYMIYGGLKAMLEVRQLLDAQLA